MATLFFYPNMSIAMCVCRVHGNCPSVLVSRWQLSLFFIRTCQLPCVLQGTRQLPLCACKQMTTLSFARTCCFAMSLCSATRQLSSVSRWQLLRFSNHGNCSKPNHTWQLLSVSRWQPLKFSNHDNYSKPDHT